MSAVPGSGALEKRTSCPGCGGRSFRTLVKEPYTSATLSGYLERQYEGRAQGTGTGDDYELARCEACGLAFQVNVPSPALLGDIYDRWIMPSERDRLHAQYTLDDYTYIAEQIQLLIQMLARKPHDIRILDFGMGWGEWAQMARAYGCRVAGAELSQARIDHARSQGFEIVPWDDIPSRGFEFINTEQVFEHLVHPLDTLKHIARALVPGGVIKVSVPDARKAVEAIAGGRPLASLSEQEMMTVAPLEHINSFEAASLEKLGEAAGLALMTPKLAQIYNASSGWLQPKRALRLLARPVYRHWYPKSTFAYFVKR